MLANMNWLDWVFLISAIFGGCLMVVRLALQLIGHHGEFNVDGHTFDTGDGIQDSDVSFKLLSLQGITAFFVMFGLVGLAIRRTYGAASPEKMWVSPVAAIGGLAAGALGFLVIVKIFAWMKKLQSSGTIDMKNAVGQEGTMYLTIHKDGIGKAQITVQGNQMIFDAVSEDKQEIKTGEHVRVIKVISGNVLVVQKA